MGLFGRAQHPPQTGWQAFSNEPASTPDDTDEFVEILRYVVEEKGGSYDVAEDGSGWEISYGRKTKVFGPGESERARQFVGMSRRAA